MLGLMEDAVDAIVLQLQAQFPAKVAALNAEYADTITLVEPAAYSTAEVIEQDAYPLVEVLGQEMPDVGGNDGPGQFNALQAVSVIVTVKDDTTPDVLRRMVYRYARAVIEIIKQGRGVIGTPAAVGGKAFTIQWGTPLCDFSPAFRQRNTSTILADCIINVRLNRQEVF